MSQADITPPASPTKMAPQFNTSVDQSRPSTPSAAAAGVAAATAVANKLSPFLNRANSFMSRARPSPRRRDSEVSTSSTTSRQGGRQRSNLSTSSFSDFFDLSASTTQIQYGLALAPRKGHARGSNETSSNPSRNHANRPIHSRSNSTFSNLLGLSHSGSRSPVRQPRRIIEEDEADKEDELLHLDLEKELFPDGVPSHDLVPSEAYDALISNASRLFLRMQQAYGEKAATLREYRNLEKEDDEELDEAKERARHLKLQLDGMSGKVAESREETRRLRQELSESRHTIKDEVSFHGLRVVSAEGEESILFDETRDAPSHSDADDTESISAASEWSAAPSTSSFTSMSHKSSSGQHTPRSWGNANSAFMRDGHLSLSEENQRLKARIAELEETVNGCLGLVESLH